MSKNLTNNDPIIDYVKEKWMKKFENEFNVKIDRDLKEVVKNK